MSQFILALLGEQYVSPLILRFDLIFRSERSFFVQIPHCGFEKYLFERWNKQMMESKVFADNFSRSFSEWGLLSVPQRSTGPQQVDDSPVQGTPV